MNNKNTAARPAAACLAALLLLSGCAGRGSKAETAAAEPAPAAAEAAAPALPAAHEHSYAPATCTEPERCDCGATQGEPLGHQAAGEADYQSGVLCERCGAEVLPPLTPGFEEHGLSCTMAPNADYTYVVPCGSGSSLTTAGKARIRSVSILPECEGYEPLEGYEWRFVTAEVSFSDENARTYGASFITCEEDYYTIELHDDSASPIPAPAEDTADSAAGSAAPRTRYTVNWQGEDYADCLWEYTEIPLGWMNGTYTCELRWAFRVPAGYDGCVVGFCGTAPAGRYIYETSDDSRLFFRVTAEY